MNCVEYLDLWFACGKIGAICRTLNWRLTPNELAGLIADAAPTVLVYGGEFETAVLPCAPATACGISSPRSLGQPDVHLSGERDTVYQ